MLGVPGLVEEGAPVVCAAHRLDDEDDAAGDLDRRQNARGLFFGRCSTSSSTFCCDLRSTPMSVSVASSAGSIFSFGNCGSHSGARKVRMTSQRFASSRLTPTRDRKACPPPARRPSPSSREALGTGRRARRAGSRSGGEVGVVRRLELLDALADDVDALGVERVEVLLGQLDADAVDLLALVAVGSFAIVGRSIRKDRLSVDVGLEVASSSAAFSPLLARRAPEVALGGSPELADPRSPFAVSPSACACSSWSARNSARRSGPARAFLESPA